MWDHSGQCPVQYLENIGPATEQSDWLILVIGPLNLLSGVISPGISRYWLASYKRTLVLQSVSYNYLYITFCRFLGREGLTAPTFKARGGI